MVNIDLHPAAVGFGRSSAFEFRFPQPHEQLDQDEAWCEVKMDGKWERFRFHDYHRIFGVPGLYESLFYRTLRCCSPVRVTQLLADVLREAGQAPDRLRALDLGAGNGMVGEALQNIGVEQMVGVDIIPEAREATLRDRSWVYNDYFVADMTSLEEPVEEAMRAFEPNLLMTVAALGFGDVPDQAFLRSLDLIDTPGWVAFNVRDDFLHDPDESGFTGLIAKLKRRGVLQIQAYRRYCHRLSFSGEPLYYIGVVATKLQEVPDDLLQP